METQTTASEKTGDRWFWIALSAIAILGLALRIGGSTGELWLDELWTLMLVKPLQSASEVFTRIHHENNHYLISLWMWACGSDRAWWVYRVPSIVAGTIAVLSAIRIGLRQSRATAFVATLLFSISYLGVFYSSEARGYAIAGAMALVGYDCLETYLRSRSWASAAGYGAAIVIGMMGNLSYASAAVALGLWSAAVLLAKERTWKSALQFVALHIVPVAILGGLWWVDIRRMGGGVGPRLGLWSVLCETVSYTFGLPGDAWLGGALVVCVAAFVVWQIVQMARGGDLRWVFFATGLVLAPAALLAWTGRVYLYPRYFLVNVYLLYLLAALAIGRAWAMRRTQLLISATLALWTLGNVMLAVQLWRVGRGHYKDALTYIAANTPGTNIRIGSVQDFRAELLVGYYTKYLPAGESTELVPTSAISKLRPEWLLSTISPYEMAQLPGMIETSSGMRYKLVKEFPSTKLSGFAAGVYRREDLPEKEVH